MALILHIDTAIDKASICIGEDGKLVGYAENSTMGEQASWIHTAIDELFKERDILLSGLDAIAVSNGPGSYTGLRIGLSTAKGLCYAFNKPLICLSTLQIMANAVLKDAQEFICPVIDARRMEVYTAVYDQFLNTVLQPQAMIIDKDSFSEILINHHILVIGNAIKKVQQVVNHPNISYADYAVNSADMLDLALTLYNNKEFTNVAYAEPFYVKNVYIKQTN